IADNQGEGTILNDDQDYTWDNGGGDNNWSTAANWDPDGIPGSMDGTIFSGATGNSNVDTDFTVGFLQVDNDYNGTLTVNANQTLTTETSTLLDLGADGAFVISTDAVLRNLGNFTLTGTGY